MRLPATKVDLQAPRVGPTAFSLMSRCSGFRLFPREISNLDAVDPCKKVDFHSLSYNVV